MFGLSNSKPSILLVDDDPNVGAALKRQAHPFFKLTEANRPELALDLISSSATFDAILSDLRMPIMDGLAFLERAKLLAPDTPLFLFTGVLDHPDLRKETMRLGLRGTFFKPLNSMAIIAGIQRSLS